MKKLILLIVLLISSIYSYGQTFQVDTLLFSGSTTNRINLVILPDGYTSTQLSREIVDGNKVTDSIFTYFPFSQYANFCNVFLLRVTSVDSGIKQPSTCGSLLTPNNYFSSTMGAGGVCRGVAGNSTTINNVLLANTPYYDIPILMVNTPLYGGLSDGATIGFTKGNTAFAEVIRHELGHALAGLTDEYPYGGCAYSSEAWNASHDTSRITNRWRKWFAGGKPNPTGPQQITDNTCDTCVGLYLGAAYCGSGWYRPQRHCKMQALGYKYCKVDLERFAYAFSYFDNLIDAYSPLLTSITLSGTQTQTFSITTINPLINSLKIQWSLDGTLLNIGSSSWIGHNTIVSGTHTVKVTVTDSTHLSRTTMPIYSHSWTLITTGYNPPPSCAIPANLASSSITPTTANLAWTVLNTAPTYRISYTKSGGSTLTKTSTTVSTSLTGLIANSSYSWKVRSLCSSSDSSDYSSPVSFNTLPSGCTVPASLSATSVTQTSATLNWGGAVNAVSYKIGINNRVFSTSSTLLSVTGLTANTNYTWTVKSICASDSSNNGISNLTTLPVHVTTFIIDSLYTVLNAGNLKIYYHVPVGTVRLKAYYNQTGLPLNRLLFNVSYLIGYFNTSMAIGVSYDMIAYAYNASGMVIGTSPVVTFRTGTKTGRIYP